ncbi:uncharacterized protein LOC132017918 isoform X1 [Mustela nigripes]|uniref:uncharacterized protein LOC132017918 isoform X1 n=1 Tax=Mustela nigripes TaxID=77151 RepID=UPI0028150FA4|nr:uncharacterized protein LOC132017918 isoform X1 [Mustela nigripes]
MGTSEGPSCSTLRTAWPLLPLRCGMMAQDFWKLQKLLFLNGGPKVSCDLVSRAACAPNPGVLFFLFVLPLRLAPPPLATVQVPERAGMLPLSTPTATPSAPTPGTHGNPLSPVTSALPSPARCPRASFYEPLQSIGDPEMLSVPASQARPSGLSSSLPPPVSSSPASKHRRCRPVLGHFSSPSVPTQVTSSTFSALNAI